jgi:hydroxyacylglutathione hydrolase
VLTIHHFLRGPLGNNMFLLVDVASSRAAVVDPGIESEDLLTFAQQHGWRIELIINTHAHFDHVYNNGWFAAQTGAPIALHAADLPLLRNLQQTCIAWGVRAPDASPEPSIELKHGEALDVFGHLFEVRHTPGHSPGQVALLIDAGDGILQLEQGSEVTGNRGQVLGSQDLPSPSKGQLPDTPVTCNLKPKTSPIALVGDTLFNRGVGRWDLPGANWDELERSIREQLYTLPDETLVLPGHMEFTTIGEEKRFNPYVGAGARFTVKP